MSSLFVHAFVFLQSPLSPGVSSGRIKEALPSVLQPDLIPLSSAILLSEQLLYQSFQSANTSFLPLEVRDARRSPRSVNFEREFSAELVLLPSSTSSNDSSPAFRPLRLAIFDMDSTLIDQEVIDELAEEVGRKAEVQAITERAMRGELDFSASLRERVKMLRGVKADVWELLRKRITITRGAKELCAALKRMDAKLAVFSGGFQPMAEWLKGELDLDLAVANHLLTSPANDTFPYTHLTGELDPNYPIIDSMQKRHLLLELAKEHHIPLEQVLCVGDGANDLPMLLAVGEGGGIGLACRAKPKVQAEATNRLSLGRAGLADLIWLFNPEGAKAAASSASSQ